MPIDRKFEDLVPDYDQRIEDLRYGDDETYTCYDCDTKSDNIDKFETVNNKHLCCEKCLAINYVQCSKCDNYYSEDHIDDEICRDCIEKIADDLHDGMCGDR